MAIVSLSFLSIVIVRSFFCFFFFFFRLFGRSHSWFKWKQWITSAIDLIWLEWSAPSIFRRSAESLIAFERFISVSCVEPFEFAFLLSKFTDAVIEICALKPCWTLCTLCAPTSLFLSLCPWPSHRHLSNGVKRLRCRYSNIRIGTRVEHKINIPIRIQLFVSSSAGMCDTFAV